MPIASALSYGPGAASLFHGRGVVYAAFSNALYLRNEEGDLSTLVDSQQADGPITIRVSDLERALPALGGIAGREYRADGSALNIWGQLIVDLAGARPWVPPRVTLRADHSELSGVISQLQAILRTAGPKSGLTPLIAYVAMPLEARPKLLVGSPTDTDDPLVGKAARALVRLGEEWQRGDAKGAASSVINLLGLGPGLTPSGDDFLAGMLAILKWFEQDNEQAALIGHALARVVVKEAQRRTTQLSAQLLAHAANGVLYEPAMSLGATLLAGRIDSLEPAALRLLKIGHTSGADMAAGILVGARLWIG